MSAADSQVTFTRFNDLAGANKKEFRKTWAEFTGDIENAHQYDSKSDCPLIKMAKFGEQRTANNSLRHDANVLTVSGLEGDYDGGVVTIEAAAEKLVCAGATAMFYTSPSHTDQAPRWRVVCPLSREYPPAERRRFVARLNGVLGGILAPESFALSQVYYIGRVNGSPYATRSVDGLCIDVIDELDGIAIDNAPREGRARGEKAKQARDTDPVIARLRERGRIKRDRSDGGVDIVCPFESSHTAPGGESATTYFAAHTSGYAQGHFVCKHSHCAERVDSDFLAALGLAHEQAQPKADARLNDFWAYLPDHKYIHMPTRALWPAASVDGNVKPWPKSAGGDKIKPSIYLDLQRAVQQMTWHPDFPEIIHDRLAYEGGWIERPGARTFNLYRPPNVFKGDAKEVTLWRDHLRWIYPTDADHIEHWLAQRIQHPGTKINHALVLGGAQGIGKDSLLGPIRQGVGPWNFKEVSPQQMLGRFNPFVRAVVLRVSETRDLGDVDRFAFYEHCKTYTTSPPDVLLCDEKHLREHPVHNVMGVVFTTNYKSSGIYLPPDDRRHYVAWSDIKREEFTSTYWRTFWDWMSDDDGIGNVIAFLRELDLTGFDPKAEPRKTDAWFAIVTANIAQEDSDLGELIAHIKSPPVLILKHLIDAASLLRRHEIIADLTERARRRAVPHKLERAGYSALPNPNAKDGRWTVDGAQAVIYGHNVRTRSELIAAANDLCTRNERARAYGAAHNGQ